MKNRAVYNTQTFEGKVEVEESRRTKKPAGVGASVRREIMCHRVGTRHGLDDR